ncbi:MAG: chorismate-binding protein [Bacteroidota bacterium]
MRKWFSFSIGGSARAFEQKLYQLVHDFEHAVVLTDKYPFYNGHAHQYKEFDLMAGFDALDVFTDDIRELESAANRLNDWLLGYFSYDLKNELESALTTENRGPIGFQKLRFFRPRYLIKKSGENWHLGYDTRHDTPRSCNNFLDNLKAGTNPDSELPDIEFEAGVTREYYLNTVEKLKNHIRRGDIYEINYCIDFFAENVSLNPSFVFDSLLELAPMPFGALVRDHDSFLMGASPERYLRKRGARIISQPMKGTARRNPESFDDLQVMKGLAESDKERAENIMIADLVRNDLSRMAARGTVKVDDLCSVFSYPGVYQMITTISAQMHSDARWLDPVRSSFPMGSMTGAPKFSAMKLIDRYERMARELYSGSVGYITPEMDFDFNVVIRSFLYNQHSGYLSYTVGSAITDACDASSEYDECLLKANALRGVFNKNKVKYGSVAG